MDSANLYNQNAGRDAIYVLYLLKDGVDRYVVRSDWGRRGSLLQTTIKPAFPTSRDLATNIYRTILKEKTREGYEYTGADAPRLLTNGEVYGSYEIIKGGKVYEAKRVEPEPVAALVCPRCNAKFAQEYEYIKHMEAHYAIEMQEQRARRAGATPSYACATCQQAFSTPGALRFHRRVMHKEEPPDPPGAFGRPYQCSQCDLGFESLRLLTEHTFAVHAKTKPSLRQRLEGQGKPEPPEDKPSLTKRATRKIVFDDDE
jgi:DNA-directed RNA polymerase subunit RPC12/RpoP/predicted DNA-binding WGR domain protein